MASRTVTRELLAAAVCKEVRLSRDEAAKLVETVLEEISDTLERGEPVKISSFGNFVVRRKGQRIGRNPRTGQEVTIAPRRALTFHASLLLKRKINEAVFPLDRR